MKKQTLGLLVALAVSAIALPAVAEAAVQLPAGTQEASVAGNLNFNNNYDLNLNGSYGYFVKDNWEVGTNVGTSISKPNKSVQVGAFTEYNFTNSTNWVPYVGAAAQFASLNYNKETGLDGNLGSGSAATARHHTNGLNIKVTTGVKYFINPNVALSASVNYNISTAKVNFTSGEARKSLTNIDFGTHFYF